MAKTKTKKKAAKGKSPAKINCRITPRISQAGMRLVGEGDPQSGRLLATDAKKLKAARLKRGCLNGTTFKLSAAQKRKLPPAMQKGIIAYQRKLGKKIIK